VILATFLDRLPMKEGMVDMLDRELLGGDVVED
jgi:hypothetical protein